MNEFGSFLVVLGVILTLDSTLGRWLIGRLTKTFEVVEMPGSVPETDRVVVFMPGMMQDGVRSVAAVKEAILEGVSSGLFFSYGYWRFKPKEFVKRAAEKIGYAPRADMQLVLHGSSYGGRLCGELAELLRAKYGWSETSIGRVVMDDTPSQRDTFKPGPEQASRILSKLYVGPLVSLLVWPIIRMTLVGPYEGQIDEDLDVPTIQRTAVRNMARFFLSSVCDQQRYLAKDNFSWTVGLADLDIVYLVCTEANITVDQPAAMRSVQMHTRHLSGRFAIIPVRSPHVGFTQRPKAWGSAIREAQGEVFPDHRMD